MENVILLIHLLLALALIAVVLLQRSEGGGLGIGGGGNVSTGRAAATAMGKVTWILGIALFATTLTLTVIAAQNSGSSSVLDRLTDDLPGRATESTSDENTDGQGLLPPTSGDDAPLVPSAE
ncbi:MAG: preprotein translocase subunit SecG [Pseudomonadota bacterium]